MQLRGLLILFLLYRKTNIDLLATHFAQKINLFVKKCKELKLPGVLSLAEWAGLTRQTRLHGKISARLAGILAPRYRDLA